jgi:hypothetical protein
LVTSFESDNIIGSMILSGLVTFQLPFTATSHLLVIRDEIKRKNVTMGKVICACIKKMCLVFFFEQKIQKTKRNIGYKI